MTHSTATLTSTSTGAALGAMDGSLASFVFAVLAAYFIGKALDYGITYFKSSIGK